MNQEKVNLIIKNMELLVQSLKLELEDNDINNQESIWKQQFPEHFISDEYEPDYYEEE